MIKPLTFPSKNYCVLQIIDIKRFTKSKKFHFPIKKDEFLCACKYIIYNSYKQLIFYF